MKQPSVARSRSPNWRQCFGLLKQGTLTEGEGTVDLQVLTCLDQLLLILTLLFTFSAKQEEVYSISPSLSASVSVPW